MSTALEDRGAVARPAIEDNLHIFWNLLQDFGIHRNEVLKTLSHEESRLRVTSLEEIQHLSRGAEVPFEDLLAFNLYEDAVFRDGCTVLVAMGKASSSGCPILLKNSDKVGGKTLEGPNFHLNKEINIIQDTHSDSGHRILGVCAAGSTGIKMGMNDAGVVTASNIGRTTELKNKKVDLTSLRAIDRAQIMRDGLEFDNAHEAADKTLSDLMGNPMSTPGNVEFLDKKECFIIEGSYTQFAVEIVRGDQVASRANHFRLLDQLNDPEDIAGHKRYSRCMELLEQNYGDISREKMIEFSMDHSNGPGPNSICRYGETPEEETSLAAMVMEINPENPKKSVASICLGKPSYAWRDPAGNLTITMDSPASEIPEEFFSGATWKQFYSEKPYSA